MTDATLSIALSLDVRALPPAERHRRFLEAFDALNAGDTMAFVNDHDPRPLHDQLRRHTTAGFTWRTLETGPAAWRVAITRTQAEPAQPGGGGCCGGGCGGGARSAT